MGFIKGLELGSFRSYESVRLTDLPRGFVVLTGDNGAGKTNILEAISLVSHPRGLRQCRLNEAQRHQDGVPLSVSLILDDPYGDHRLSLGLAEDLSTKILRLNGETVRAYSRFQDLLRCVWLTPQMDGLFMAAAGERRRFFDRLVASFDPAHLGRLNRYDKSLSERSKLLKDDRPADPAWLDALETQMAEAAIAIAAARADHLHRLEQQWDRVIPASLPFPKSLLSLDGLGETLLSDGHTALDIEERLMQEYRDSRPRDAINGGAQYGAHKCDLSVVYADKNMPASACSTGEQKALLIGLVLANSAILHALHDQAPILLLDEVAAHLDSGRRAALFDLLNHMQAQVWITGTDKGVFESLPGQSIHYSITPGHVNPLGFEG